jgi:hypothetical protein
MSFLVPIILLHEMEIITTTKDAQVSPIFKIQRELPNYDSAVHFGRDNHSGKSTTTDGDLTGERTFLAYFFVSGSVWISAGGKIGTNVGSFNCFFRGFEAKPC